MLKGQSCDALIKPFWQWVQKKKRAVVKFIKDLVQASEAGIGPSEAKAMLRK